MKEALGGLLKSPSSRLFLRLLVGSCLLVEAEVVRQTDCVAA